MKEAITKLCEFWIMKGFIDHNYYHEQVLEKQTVNALTGIFRIARSLCAAREG